MSSGSVREICAENKIDPIRFYGHIGRNQVRVMLSSPIDGWFGWSIKKLHRNFTMQLGEILQLSRLV